MTIEQVIDSCESRFNDSEPFTDVEATFLQALATAHVAKQTERQVDALNGIRTAIEQAGGKVTRIANQSWRRP